MWILVEPGEAALSVGGDSWVDRIAAAAAGGAPIAIVTRVRKDGRDLVFDGRAFVALDAVMAGGFGDARDGSASRQSQAPRQIRHGTPRAVAVDETHDVLIEPVVAAPAAGRSPAAVTSRSRSRGRRSCSTST